MTSRARAVAVIVVLLVLVVAALLARRAIQVVSIGTAYKAKMLCSGIYVSRRGPRDVLADLEVDDLTMMRRITTTIDTDAKSVKATALGLIRREARYRENAGCSLVIDGRMPESQTSPEKVAPATDGFGAVEKLDRLDPILERAFAEPNPQHLRRTRAIVVLHKGRIVAERYATGIGPDTPLLGWSMTKSVFSALVGILVNDGRLSLNTPLQLPGWQTSGDARNRITLDHLLRMSSGLQFDEDPRHQPADVTRMLLAVPDAAAYAMNKKLEVAPGTRWQYSSGNTNIISRVIRNAIHDDHEYAAFPRRALFDRIGMSGAVMETDPSGTFVGSSFMYATARDWARLGMLYSHDGVWDGQRILPEGWIAYSRTPAPSDPRRHYGAHFWLQMPDEFRGSGASLPEDSFHAIGYEAQFVTIVPSRDAVIVRMGLTRYPDAWDHPAFVRDVLAALPTP
jgi:CubicO group peptidase (beta-lactamase class C family)